MFTTMPKPPAERQERHEPGGIVMSLFDLDGEKQGLMDKHPGWRVWYVPRTQGGVSWHAQRLPILDADTPAELDKAITGIERQSAK
jgi:hypothetical protein